MSAPDLLSELAIKYGSDKWSAKHSYTAWYYQQFAARRDSVRKVVEIGVGEGASLRMWREFFPNAMIYGMDNQYSRVFHDDRIQVIYGDQTDWDDLKNLYRNTGDNIDLFIDDGTHLAADQSYTCCVYLPQLQDSVVYVIEDVVDRYVIEKNFEDDDKDFTIEEPALEKRNRYDNRLLVIHA